MNFSRELTVSQQRHESQATRYRSSYASFGPKNVNSFQIRGFSTMIPQQTNVFCSPPTRFFAFSSLQQTCHPNRIFMNLVWRKNPREKSLTPSHVSVILSEISFYTRIFDRARKTISAELYLSDVANFMYTCWRRDIFLRID
jgi:hypothetical protein